MGDDLNCGLNDGWLLDVSRSCCGGRARGRTRQNRSREGCKCFATARELRFYRVAGALTGARDHVYGGYATQGSHI